MGKQRITFNLSAASVKDAQKRLLAYRSELLDKCQRFIERLAEIGIETAESRVGDLGRYILFEKEVDRERYQIKGVMYATNTGVITSEWRTADGTKSADISPILMAEFGSGLPAQKNPMGKEFGMGTGTFPGQTHAEDPSGWWWQTLDNEWHHSYGITPTMPMWHAADQMFNNIQRAAKDVFG